MTTRAVRKAAEMQALEQLLRCEKYKWPNEEIRQQFLEIAGQRPAVDLSSLETKGRASRVNGETLVISLVSKEYLNLGRNWIRKIVEMEVGKVFLVCGDRESHDYFSRQNIPCWRIAIPEYLERSSEKNFAGFNPKGLILAAMRYLACREGICRGYDVIFSDIDAFWMRNPVPHLKQLSCDFAFQSVIGFPRELVELWGFTACSGFFYLRCSEKTRNFCDRMISLMENTAADQLVMNTILAQLDVTWPEPVLKMDDGGEVKGAAYPAMHKCVTGRSRAEDWTVVALAQKLYRRHMWMRVPIEDAIILHPNSPKEEGPKLDIFRQLGVEII